MSAPLTGLPNPHQSTSPIPFVAVPDVRLLLWSYRVLRSLQSNLSSGQLIHQPYYRPVSALGQGYMSRFSPFSNLFLPKSQAPTLVHSTHDIFSLSPFYTILILSSYSAISDIKDKSSLFGYSETSILRSTEGVLSTGKPPALQTPLCTCG